MRESLNKRLSNLKTWLFPTDPFLNSVMARSAGLRLVALSLVILGLWGAVCWAVALP